MVIKLGAGGKREGHVGRDFAWAPGAKAAFESELARFQLHKKKLKKPFNVFEAGTGKLPLALLRKAQKSSGTRKRRVFTGVDKELNLDLFLKKTGLKGLPKNLRLRQNCAIRELSDLPRESQGVILGSYLVNNISSEEPSCVIRGLPCNRAFFIAADMALRPGGRLVLVQGRMAAHLMKEAAFNLGYELHSKIIPDAAAIKSKSWAIRLRSNPEKRERDVRIEIGDEATVKKELKNLKKMGFNSFEEATQPCIFSLRKPKTPQGRLKARAKVLPQGQKDPLMSFPKNMPERMRKEFGL